jgi:hypothetical protein
LAISPAEMQVRAKSSIRFFDEVENLLRDMMYGVICAARIEPTAKKAA